MKFNDLFKPIKVNSLMFNNRIVAAPAQGGGIETPEKMRCGAAVNILGQTLLYLHLQGIVKSLVNYNNFPYKQISMRQNVAKEQKATKS